MFNPRYCFGSYPFKKLSTEAISCRVLVLLDTIMKLCSFPEETLYETITFELCLTYIDV